MTFGYINNLFKLPPDFLKGKLSINDAGYPQISIRNLAKSDHLDENTLLSSVQQVVGDYSK